MTSSDPPSLENPNPPVPVPVPVPDSEDPPQPTIQQPECPRKTLEIPDNDDQDNPDEIAPFSPRAKAACFHRRGPKRKKMDKKRAIQEKAWKKKLEVVSKSLNPVPFVPGMAFDLAAHEALLRRVGLWDFVNLEFDMSLRADLIAQLIATFSRDSRVSYVNGVRIKVNRADLGRALRLPRKDKGGGGGGESSSEVKASKEDVGFMEKMVMNWMLLHEDMWMMPAEVLNWMGLIKEGSFERMDWAGLIWFMVEKELLGKPDFGNCYYASHLQCLIKHQRRDLFEGGVVKMEVDVDEDEEVRVCEEVSGGVGSKDAVNDVDRGETVVEGNSMNNEDKEDIMVEDSLAKDDDKGELPVEERVAKDDDKEERSVEENVAKDEDKEGIVIGENVSEFHDGKEVEKIEQVITTSMDGFIFGRCNQIGVEGVDFEEDRKHGKDVGGEEEMKEIEDDGEEKEIGEDESDENGFNIVPSRQCFERVASENLISGMEAVQYPFTSELHMPNNESGQFLMSNVEAQRMPGSSSLFGNCSGNKRDIAHLENDFPHHSLDGGNKRMRNDDGPWENKISSDMDIYMDQMQHMMEKCKMMYNAKEQAYQEMCMNQELYLEELQRRENAIQHFKEEAQKKQRENFKLERELYMMGNLLDGYRKALKGTQKAFSDYRAKCQLPQEPIYKDAGCGGLVLSKMELERQRIKVEEEEKLILLDLKKKILDFEARIALEFGAHINAVNLLSDKLSSLEKKANLLKENFARRTTLDMPESAPSLEGCTTLNMPESAPSLEGCTTLNMPESAPSLEGCTTLNMPESAPNVEGCTTLDIPESAPNAEGCMAIDILESAPNAEGCVTLDMPESAPNVEG